MNRRLPARDACVFVAIVVRLAMLSACASRDTIAPDVQLAVSDVSAAGAATCNFAYQCTQTVRYATVDLATGRNVAGEVAITGAGTHPETATSGPLGVGEFAWTYSAEPGVHQIEVCPNGPTPIQARCRTMDVTIGE